jgi:single-strand DNA-binding protein
MFQQLILAGYLGADPELRFMPSGDPVATLSVATSKTYTDKGGQKVESTTWFRVSVFGKQAESCNQYLKKGSPVLVVGELKPDPETGGPHVYQRKDGTSGANFEVTAQTVRFLPSRNDETASYNQEPVSDDDIPF